MSETDRLHADFVDAFEEELAPRAEDATKLDAMVIAALDGGPPGAGPDPGSGSGPGPGGGSSMILGFSAVVATIAIVAVILLPSGEPTPSPTPTPAPASAPVRHDAPTKPASAPEAEPAAAAAPALETTRTATPDPIEPEADTAPPPERSAKPKAQADPPSAAELLRRANEARRAHDYAKADHLFDRLAREHAGSREEVLARVTHGALLLDRLKQPKAALKRFDAYLADKPSGTLAEEALVGRAQALAKLGQVDAEADAWKALVDRFPGSAHAPAARRRIDALGR